MCFSVNLSRMRTTNLPLLADWLTKNGAMALVDLSHKTRIQFFTLRKISKGQRKANELEQAAICKATGLDMNALFPRVQSEEKAS